MRQADIAVIHLKSIPAELFAGFAESVSSEKLNLQIQSREDGGAFAALEWLLPTAVIVYIGKSYFDGFLKEMGKDHYSLLKAGLKKLQAKLFGSSAPQITLFGSAGKISKEQPYSLVFSIVAEAESGITFKLLVHADVSEGEYEETIAAFLEFLASFHANSLDAPMVESLNASRVVGRTLLLAFNREAKAIEPVDPVPKRGPPNEA
ncbi:hypothetical protein [Dechloromonas denitrificans]|uniref:hypothetical protein n=1 Tax=Dechloromonas denitrificans TaxID=281362 RepID=UPI001CF92169|nr:hypothetical protein [Dechloromonas denitrificans]UCV02773.1 hypothetical protein KI611_17045 [Dechloromonas denitrificans]